MIDPTKGGELMKAGVRAVPVTLSTRIRLARNLLGFPFPGWAETSQRRAVLSACREAAVSLKTFKDPISFEVDDLNDLQKLVLVERHVISRELLQIDEAAGAVLNADQSVSIMINEEDHLRMQVLRKGFDLNAVWKTAKRMDLEMENALDYAFSADYGFLTACPTNLGTGMRASVMMHLPGLFLSKHMEKVIRGVNELGIAVRGLFGEGTDASGNIFQISNQQTLGEGEEEILERLGKTLEQVKTQEINARESILESEKQMLFDKIGRAYGVLSNAYMITSSDAMDSLSLMRLAVDLGILPEKCRAVVDGSFIQCQPGHIQYQVGHSVEPDERDAMRAEFLRGKFAKFTSLNFDKS
jgi:protein arginine kinase